MAFRRGDVLLVPFPFSDLSATKVRPAVVISSAVYHAAEPDLILALRIGDCGLRIRGPSTPKSEIRNQQWS